MSQTNQLLNRLIQDTIAAQQRANQANEQRFQQLLGLSDQFGQTGRQDAQSAAIRQQAQAQQSLISRGLGNTTILDAANRGVQSDFQRQLLDVNERVAQQRAGIIERRDDVGPDLNALIALAQQTGAANTAPVQAPVQVNRPLQPLAQTLQQRLGSAPAAAPQTGPAGVARVIRNPRFAPPTPTPAGGAFVIRGR